MKPTTKLQKKVVELSAKLPPITDKQMTWAIDQTESHAVRSRKTLYCLECGHSWKDESFLVSQLVGCECPECGRELKMKDNANIAESYYFAIITTKQRFQVVRMFWVQKSFKKGKPSYSWTSEVMQHWINQSGKVTTISKKVQGLSRYYDQWIHSSDLEIRTEGSYGSNARYDIKPLKIYPTRSVLPELKRNGFSGHFHGYTPHKLFSLLLSVPAAETIIKSRQMSLFNRLFSNPEEIKKFWPSIRICLRNDYTVKDASIWIDYLNLLQHFGRDLNNAVYVCPADLKNAHDRFVKKKRLQDRKKKLADLREQMQEQQLEYEKQKGKFFNLLFEEDNIRIKPLTSVEQFLDEGTEMGHCVFESEYFKKETSLILSAQVDSLPMETVEVSLLNLKVIQSRGAGNGMTKHHKKIVNLVNNNMQQIHKIMQHSVSV